ncbi:MAG: manganese efflux pump MntP family protein [Candidatus Avilachnospira sp.]|jgi:putative Mn2+ efflux pump MntP
MGIAEIFMIGAGLSMDAFAASVCKGLSAERINPKNAVITGLYFGGFQAGMPLLGYFLGTGFKDAIMSIDHWIAFILLLLIGLNMIKESREKEDCGCDKGEETELFSPKELLPLAVGTSIDALAVGVSFAFLNVNIITAVCLIGVTTFVFSALGVGAGSRLGMRFKSWAEFAGGLILILMGTKILLEHLGFLG